MKLNKKILFLILVAIIVIYPFLTSAATVQTMVDKVKDIAVAISVSIVVIGWIIAGSLYLLSMGSPEKTGVAKKAMIAALIGTILIVLIGPAAGTITGIIRDFLGL